MEPETNCRVPLRGNWRHTVHTLSTCLPYRGSTGRSITTPKSRLIRPDQLLRIVRTTRCLRQFAVQTAAGALVGFANFLLRLYTNQQPRAVLLGWDTLDAPTYRHDAFDAYQSGRENSTTSSRLIPRVASSLIASQLIAAKVSCRAISG
jgi:hypothetical protein